jgi:hypothetical protein
MGFWAITGEFKCPLDSFTPLVGFPSCMSYKTLMVCLCNLFYFSTSFSLSITISLYLIPHTNTKAFYFISFWFVHFNSYQIHFLRPSTLMCCSSFFSTAIDCFVSIAHCMCIINSFSASLILIRTKQVVHKRNHYKVTKI